MVGATSHVMRNDYMLLGLEIKSGGNSGINSDGNAVIKALAAKRVVLIGF